MFIETEKIQNYLLGIVSLNFGHTWLWQHNTSNEYILTSENKTTQCAIYSNGLIEIS